MCAIATDRILAVLTTIIVLGAISQHLSSTLVGIVIFLVLASYCTLRSVRNIDIPTV